MRLLHPGNCLRFLRFTRISQIQPGRLGSLTFATEGSLTSFRYSKCKHTNTCFAFTQKGHNFCPLLRLKCPQTSTSHLGLKTSCSNYSTGEGANDFGKDAIVREILKDIKDDFEKEFKEEKTGRHDEEEQHQQHKAEMKIDEQNNEYCDKPLSVSSSSNLFKIGDDGAGIDIIGGSSSTDFVSSSSSIDEENEVEDLVSEREDEGDDIEDFIDYGYTIDDEDDSDVQVYTPPIELKRGTTGVFDIEDLVTVLEDENGIDVCVIDVPESKNYVDYMVIVSGKSARHIRSMAENIRWLYKQKKQKSDPFVQIEGLQTNNWLAMDLGNIALHIFLPQMREKYDLETLWTIGDLGDESNLEFDDPYAMRELPVQEPNENAVQGKEATDGSPGLKVEDDSDRIQNLSNIKN